MDPDPLWQTLRGRHANLGAGCLELLDRRLSFEETLKDYHPELAPECTPASVMRWPWWQGKKSTRRRAWHASSRFTEPPEQLPRDKGTPCVLIVISLGHRIADGTGRA